MSERNNSFDLIRHFAAILVLFSHHFRLSGYEEPVIRNWDTLGFIAVAIFFAISGYFMPTSFSNSGSLYDFFEKRCRRIFPGLFVCSFVMVYGIGLFFTEENKLSYIFSYKNIKDMFQHTIFIHNITPGLFSDFILKDAINGSLWTLPIEFVCYLIIGSCLSFLFSWKTTLFLLWVACVATATAGTVWQSFSFYGVDARYLAMFGVPFATGSFMAMTRDSWIKHRLKLAIIALMLIWLTRIGNSVFVLGTASLAVLVIIIGTSFREKIINGKFDLSYGIYIYAFPIQQIVINNVTDNFWGGMILSLVATVMVAFMSYRYVELPFIKKKPHPFNEGKSSSPSGSITPKN